MVKGKEETEKIVEKLKSCVWLSNNNRVSFLLRSNADLCQNVLFIHMLEAFARLPFSL